MLWILSEVYYPEETGTGYYITRIAEHLASNQPVAVLCAQPGYSRSGVKAPRSETHRNVRIIRCPSIVLSQKSILKRLIRMISITVSMFVTAIFCIKRGDSLLAVTNPPSVPILAAFLSFMLRVRFSLVVHDVYPDIMAACGLVSREATSYRLLHKLSQLVLQRADRIVCIGRDMREHLTQIRGRDGGECIEVIPLWADCQEIGPIPKDKSKLLEELGLRNKLVVLYAGNMGHPHDIETLAAAIKSLEFDEDIHFLFIGSGPKRRILDEMLACGSTNITVLPPFPRAEQNSFLNACDVAILSLVPGMLGLAVPSRIYNLMAAGKPLIAQIAESSEVAKVVMEERIGWVVEPGSIEGIVEAVQAAKASRGRHLEMGARARYAAEGKYSAETILQQFDVFFEHSREVISPR